MDENLLYNMYRFMACKDLFKRISNIPYAVVKGEALSLAAYGRPGKRSYSDIDLLVPKGYLEEVEEELCKSGFVQADVKRRDRIYLLLNSHQVPPWIKKCGENIYACIDVNFDILWGEYEEERIDIDEFLADTVDTKIFGVSVKCLTPIKTLLQVAMHHYRDMNSIYLLATKKTIRRRMFEEIYHLIINNQSEISPDGLEELCCKYHIKSYMYYMLYYTAEVVGDVKIKDYADKLRDRQGEELLPLYGLCQSERRPWKIDFAMRLNEDCLFPYMSEELTRDDLKKIEINRALFQKGTIGCGETVGMEKKLSWGELWKVDRKI